MINGSIWPIVAAAIAASLIGYVWYHPRVFGTLWMRLNNVSPEMAERGARRRHLYTALGLVANLVAAGILRMLLGGAGMTSVPNAARIGFLLWLGFVAPILLGSVLWEHRSVSLYLINAGYWLVALIAMSIILVV